MARFHSEDNLGYLEQYVSKDIAAKMGLLGIDRFNYPTLGAQEFLEKRQRFKVGESTDCPAFNGLYNMCQISAGGSIDAACLLLNGDTDIAINWTGGLHHAKKAEASGFCYVNDIVLSIVELLQVYPRVLYLDIDVHHGDGVEEAFYLSNRCMSVSFHQYGEDFFPGTGGLHEIGEHDGKHYSLNIPLKPGISDEAFVPLFKDVMQGVMAKYRPHALVVQLGADSLAYDKLGHFNLSIRGHGECLSHMLTYNLPTIMMGGGGYTVENVSRCWAYETSVALGVEIDDNIPKYDQFYNRYSFDQKLHFPVRSVEDKNTRQEIDNIRQRVFEHIREIEGAPGAQFHYLPSFMETEEPVPLWEMME
jgi:histone deacetylase 1/2